MQHSYEEIRAVTLDILAKSEIPKSIPRFPNQYEELRLCIGEILVKREGGIYPGWRGHPLEPSNEDSEIFLEVFWDMFRDGIITLGKDDANREFPFFRLTKIGKSIAENNSTYFFHDTSSYERAIRSKIPHINEITIIYLKEAMQAFRARCVLSSTVMLGVATEHTFLLLLEKIEKNALYKDTYKSVFEQKTILQKINKFKNIIDQNVKTLPANIKEDLDTNFSGILSIIRNYRNQSGHPTGEIIDLIEDECKVK